MKIIAVCGFGVGSSVIAKMNIESILDEENKSSDATVETVDLGSVSGTDGDLYVTTNELFDQIPEDIQERQLCCLISSIRMQLRKVLILSLKIWANKTKKLIL